MASTINRPPAKVRRQLLYLMIYIHYACFTQVLEKLYDMLFAGFPVHAIFLAQLSTNGLNRSGTANQIPCPRCRFVQTVTVSRLSINSQHLVVQLAE